MAGKKNLEISLINGSLALEYNDSNHSSEPIQYYPVCSIKGIIATYQPGFGTRDAKNQRRNPYDFADMLRVTVYLEGYAKEVSFDIQQVINQAGWTANLAGLKQAISDIKDWAAECGCCAETAVLLGEVNANLISILNAIVASDQDIEVLLVRDTGADDVVVQQIIDYTTGTPVYSYKDVDGNTYVPVGSLEYLDPSAVLNLILAQITALTTNTGEPLTITSVFGFDDSYTEVERRLTYDPATQALTYTYHDPAGAAIVIDGDFYSGSPYIADVLDNIFGALSGLKVADGAVPGANGWVVGGKAVDAATYAPAYSAGQFARLAFNKDTGAALVEDVGSSVPSSIGDGRKVVAIAGTPETLAASTPCKEVIITAETNNTGVIVVGGATVVASEATRRGTPLSAGDSCVIQITDLASIYIDTTISGDGVTFTYSA